MRMVKPNQAVRRMREFVSLASRHQNSRLGGYRCFTIPVREKREEGRKSGFCGRAPTARNARAGPPTLSPSSLKGLRERPVKSGISGRRKVFRRYLTWFYDRCLYGFSFLLSLPHSHSHSHSLLFFPCPAEGILP